MARSWKGVSVAILRHLGLALALMLVAATSALLTMRAGLSLHVVTVPSLIGQRLPAASSLAGQEGLTVRLAGKRPDSTVPLGAIAGQEPLAGSTLKANRTIRVWLSLGPRKRQIPNLVGTSLRSARLALDLADVPLARVIEVDQSAPEGSVIMQQPPPGDVELVEGGVSLLASRGPAGRDYVMPDFIDRSLDEVTGVLRLTGLKLAEIRYRTYPGRPPGTILSQSPRPGFRVGPRSVITLDINKVNP
jgi:beta-lactam-binding protein with PASTA domain